MVQRLVKKMAKIFFSEPGCQKYRGDNLAPPWSFSNPCGVIPGNMWGSVLGRSTQEASFLYDMYLDDEDLEAFMASVDVKGAFPNTPRRLIEEVWRQLGLVYGDFLEK